MSQKRRRFFSEIQLDFFESCCFFGLYVTYESTLLQCQTFDHIWSVVRNMNVDHRWQMTLLFDFVIQQLSCSLIAPKIGKKDKITATLYNRSIHFLQTRWRRTIMADWMSNTNSCRQLMDKGVLCVEYWVSHYFFETSIGSQIIH